jgi:U4/U6.U5 tri-snRNP component SNU23
MDRIKPREAGKWDREEYARRGREREQAEYDRRQRGGRVERPENGQQVTAREQRLDIYEGLNQVTLVPAGAAVGKRGKGAGFYCEVCNLTFKDSIQYLDHLNSKQHLHTSGQIDITRRATLEDVRNRLEYLRQKQKEKGPDQEYDIAKRIAERKRFEEEEKAEKRRRRTERNKANGRDIEDVKGETARQLDPMAQMMGFSGFGSTKR